MNSITKNNIQEIQTRHYKKDNVENSNSLKSCKNFNQQFAALSFGNNPKENEDAKKKTANVILKRAIVVMAIALGVCFSYKGISKFFNKKAVHLTEEVDFTKLKSEADELLGKGFFDEQFKKTGWENYSQIKDSTFGADLKRTLVDVPCLITDLANFIIEKLGYKPKGILAKRKAHNQKFQSRDLILNIVKLYKEKCNFNSEKFADEIAKSITQRNPNYRIRDERTITRITTGMVSTYYAGNDFYNLSMLRKNNKDDAKDAANMRMKQEGSRMLMNAAFTFFTMGALEKYTKNSKIGTVITAGVSTVIAEVVSRLISKTQLLPMSPQEAAKVARENKNKKPAQSNKKKNSHKIAFSGKNKKLEINNFPVNTNADDTKKKKLTTLQKMGLISVLLSSFYLLKNSSKTSGYAKDFIEKTKLPDLKKFITKKKIETNLDETEKTLKNLLDEKNADGNKLIDEIGARKLLNSYLRQIDILRRNGKVKNCIMTTTKDRFLITPIYGGFEKTIKTFYVIMSLPGKAIDWGLRKLSGKEKPVQDKTLKNYEKNLASLSKILNDEKLKNSTEKLKAILKNVQDVKICEMEMTDLANDCRTMVTAISSYFFVNDYRNKVLIESEGEDIQGAKEEVNTRIAHKVCNFIFNGILMNTFNNVFKGPLNTSLFAATVIPTFSEFCNENTIRLTICTPAKRMASKQDIIDYDRKTSERRGFARIWTRSFKKLTGKKSIVEKADA